MKFLTLLAVTSLALLNNANAYGTKATKKNVLKYGGPDELKAQSKKTDLKGWIIQPL